MSSIFVGENDALLNVLRILDPLYALSSVMNNCKSVYEEAKAKQQKENEESGTEFEEINMFGPLQFDALDEKSIDPKKQLDDFRKLLIVAFMNSLNKGCGLFGLDKNSGWN